MATEILEGCWDYIIACVDRLVDLALRDGDLRDAVQEEIARGATEDQAAAAIKLPQYEKMQGYTSQREVAVRRMYKEMTGKLP